MRINGSRTDGLGTNRLRVGDSQQVPYFLEIVGPSTVVCGPDIPWFIGVG
jgi:hypothetical protein